MNQDHLLPHQPSRTRLGPRPLPLHVTLHLATLLSSQAALPSWKSGSVTWKPHLRQPAAELREALAGVAADDFDLALKRELFRRLDGFAKGVVAYRRHPYRRDLPEVPVVWQEGDTRLLDYSLPGASGGAVLVIPSLINRAYILDLHERRSLLRYLAAKGLRPFLVDWGAPGAVEADFSLTEYVAGRLGRALEVVLGRAGPPALVGYCMGGLLALGLGVLRQSAVRGLALLATPWEFHRPHPDQARLVAAAKGPLEEAIAAGGTLSVDLLQTLFTMVDPGAVERKFRAFAQVKPSSAQARSFVATEDWLNDGVPLAAPVARECLFDWYVDNQPAAGGWRLAGTAVLPERFIRPALALVPLRDRLVPPASALALAEALPRCRKRLVDTGHIGMMAGRRAKTDVYSHLTKWLTLLSWG